MILLYIEKNDVLEFADGLGSIAIEDVSSASIEDIIFDERTVGVCLDRFYLVEYLGKIFFCELILGIET